MSLDELESSNAPIAIFCYNRAANLNVLLRSLANNKEFLASPLFFFSDAAKHDSEIERVSEVRKIITEFEHPNKTVNLREHNFGLRSSIIDGVTRVCEEFDRVIVLEDDLEVSRDLLSFFNACLDRYRSDRRIMSICSDFPDANNRGIGKEAIFLPVASSWGWATWRRAWALADFSVEVRDEELASRSFGQRFSGHGLRDFGTMLKSADSGRIDSWFVYWQYAVVKNSAGSIFPPHALSLNTGLTDGTHASRYSLFRWLGTPRKPLGSFDFALPANPTIDFLALDAVVRSSEWKILRWNSRFGRVKRWLKAVVGA